MVWQKKKKKQHTKDGKFQECNRKWRRCLTIILTNSSYNCDAQTEEKTRTFQASLELKEHQMLGNPRGINWHIKHNITSSAGAQSLVHSGELLYYVLLPQFKSQELEANTAQALWAHSAQHRGAMCTQHRLFLYVLSNILREMNVKSFSLQPPTQASNCLWTPNLRCNEAKLFNNKQRCIVYMRREMVPFLIFKPLLGFGCLLITSGFKTR